MTRSKLLTASLFISLAIVTACAGSANVIAGPLRLRGPGDDPRNSWLVFFDWSKATLTPHSQDVISTIVYMSKNFRLDRIEVNGYADLSGFVSKNKVLSIKRAQSVAEELIHRGLPRSAIVVQGFGSNHPLLPTEQGVAEAQNRRVEVIFR